MDLSRENVSDLMKLYRSGFIGVPQEYIALHEIAATDNIGEITKRGFTIIDKRIVNDGWGDSMKVLEVDAINITGAEKTFRWSDSNGGSWFERSKNCGGQSLFCVPENRPGFL